MGNNKDHLGGGDRDSELIHLAELGKPKRIVETDVKVGEIGHVERLVHGSEGLLIGSAGRRVARGEDFSVGKIAGLTADALRILHDHDPKRNRVLIVDDQPMTAHSQEAIMWSLFGQHGFEPEIVHDPLAVVDLLRGGMARTTAIALIDQVMPGMTGLELGKIIRPEIGMERVPILISSGEEGFLTPGSELSKELARLRKAKIFNGFIQKTEGKEVFAHEIIRAVSNAVGVAVDKLRKR